MQYNFLVFEINFIYEKCVHKLNDNNQYSKQWLFYSPNLLHLEKKFVQPMENCPCLVFVVVATNGQTPMVYPFENYFI